MDKRILVLNELRRVAAEVAPKAIRKRDLLRLSDVSDHQLRSQFESWNAALPPSALFSPRFPERGEAARALARRRRCATATAGAASNRPSRSPCTVAPPAPWRAPRASNRTMPDHCDVRPIRGRRRRPESCRLPRSALRGHATGAFRIRSMSGSAGAASENRVPAAFVRRVEKPVVRASRETLTAAAQSRRE